MSRTRGELNRSKKEILKSAAKYAVRGGVEWERGEYEESEKWRNPESSAPSAPSAPSKYHWREVEGLGRSRGRGFVEEMTEMGTGEVRGDEGVNGKKEMFGGFGRPKMNPTTREEIHRRTKKIIRLLRRVVGRT